MKMMTLLILSVPISSKAYAKKEKSVSILMTWPLIGLKRSICMSTKGFNLLWTLSEGKSSTNWPKTSWGSRLAKKKKRWSRDVSLTSFVNSSLKRWKRRSMAGIGTVPTMEIGASTNIACLRVIDSKEMLAKLSLRSRSILRLKLTRKETSCFLKIGQVISILFRSSCNLRHFHEVERRPQN